MTRALPGGSASSSPRVYWAPFPLFPQPFSCLASRLQVPVDLVIDHSVVVDEARTAGAFKVNANKEFTRNRERFEFLAWAEKAFKNLRVVPPGTGIVHQVRVSRSRYTCASRETSRQMDTFSLPASTSIGRIPMRFVCIRDIKESTYARTSRMCVCVRVCARVLVRTASSMSVNLFGRSSGGSDKDR